MEVHRGEVFYADLSPVVGSEQGGVRPVLIVQNEIGNRHSPTVIAAAITSRLDKTRLPTHINIRATFLISKVFCTILALISRNAFLISKNGLFLAND